MTRASIARALAFGVAATLARQVALRGPSHVVRRESVDATLVLAIQPPVPAEYLESSELGGHPRCGGPTVHTS